MNAAHVHLALNHIPVVAVLIGVPLLGIGMARRSADLLRAGLVVFAVAAALTLPVFLSGERAEELVEDRPDVTEDLLDAHEDAGEAAAVALAVLGVISLGMLVLYRHEAEVAQRAALVTLLVSLVVAAMVLRAANLGGQIRHPEIRTNGTVTNGEPHR